MCSRRSYDGKGTFYNIFRLNAFKKQSRPHDFVKGRWRIATQITLIATWLILNWAVVALHRPPFLRNFPIIFASFWYHHTALCIRKRLEFKGDHLISNLWRGACVRAICKRTPRPRKWQLTRLLAFLLVAVFTDVLWEHLLHFSNLYSAQNGREQSAPPVTWF